MVATMATNLPALALHSKMSATAALHCKLGLDSSSFKRAPRIGLKVFGEYISLPFDCKHSIVVNRMCQHCDRRMPDDHGIAFDYIFKGLRLTLDEIARLKVMNSEKILGHKKLHLVLDLDHTLLHAKALKKLTAEELYLKEQLDSDKLKGSSLFVSGDHLVKLRPFVRTFLKEASSLFEIYVCSMGSRNYVKKLAKFLDPEGIYFNTRLIAREDFGQKTKKNLNLVLGQESCTLIVDDTKSVWSDHLDNLIAVQRYEYFADHNHKRRKSHAEMKTDESESNGELVKVLGVLRRMHASFFDNSIDHVKDVRFLWS